MFNAAARLCFVCELEAEKQVLDSTEWTVLQMIDSLDFLTSVEFHVYLASVAEDSKPTSLSLFCILEELLHTMEKGRGKKKKKWAICSCRWGFVDGVQVAVTE